MEEINVLDEFEIPLSDISNNARDILDRIVNQNSTESTRGVKILSRIEISQKTFFRIGSARVRTQLLLHTSSYSRVSRVAAELTHIFTFLKEIAHIGFINFIESVEQYGIPIQNSRYDIPKT